MTSGKCSCGKLCVASQLQLKECQLLTNCKNLLHHACQITHEKNYGPEGEMKLRCKECADRTLSNINTNVSDANSVKNKPQSMIDTSNLDDTCDEASQK